MALRPDAVLFDLDGTLLDTAPDMVSALNVLCAEGNRPLIEYELARAHVSNGAAGLLRLMLADYDVERHRDLHRRYLEIYAGRLHHETRLFPTMAELLGGLEASRIPWGVVTNKPRYLTEPLLDRMLLLDRAAAVISGDSLPERKPHPRPVLYALETIGARPAASVYIGDASRDIQAGRAAGTVTIAARYGYIEPGQDPESWGADHVVRHPAELAALLLP
jgi:phosphoglycolate phosphatase